MPLDVALSAAAQPSLLDGAVVVAEHLGEMN
jgi:hypothetical protein